MKSKKRESLSGCEKTDERLILIALLSVDSENKSRQVMSRGPPGFCQQNSTDHSEHPISREISVWTAGSETQEPWSAGPLLRATCSALSGQRGRRQQPAPWARGRLERASPHPPVTQAESGKRLSHAMADDAGVRPQLHGLGESEGPHERETGPESTRSGP